MTKEEKIKEAWGEYYEKDINSIDSADLIYIKCRINEINHNNG